MPFRQMPDRLYDEPDELAQWAARALAAAQRQKRVPAQSPRAKAVKRKGKTRSKAAETR
jgi:DNA transformation protein